MNLKNEKGFVTEVLTIGIIAMIVVLIVLFITAINNDNKDLEIASVDESTNTEHISDNFIDIEVIESTETNEEQEENTYREEIEKILNSYNNNNEPTNASTYNNSSSVSNKDNYNKYYYNQLDDNAKAIYDAMYNNKAELKTGTKSMSIPDYVTDVLYKDNGKEQLSKLFQSAIDAIKLDNPELFYIAFNKILLITETTTKGNSKTYRLYLENEENDTYLSENFRTQEIVKKAINKVEEEKDDILANAVGSDYEKVKYIHNWVVENIEYETTISKENIHNIYGALVQREVVCGGYAKAFKYLLDALDIPCIVVQGVATNSDGVSENHAWNYVKLSGSWYAVDTTWDDPIIQGNGWSAAFYNKNTTAYFLKGSNTLFKDHSEKGAFSEGGKVFSYPTLSYEDY